jgi:hypothetical protein
MRKLGKVMYKGTYGDTIATTIETAKEILDQIFMEVASETLFINYFKAEWIHMWIKAA